MYDILQLNDMLLPELLDIAEQLQIANVKKLNKQDLIYKILDSQAVQSSDAKDDGKKKRGRKPATVVASTGNGSEEAEVMGEEAAAEEQKGRRGRKPRIEKIAPAAEAAAPNANSTSEESAEKPADNISSLAEAMLAATEEQPAPQPAARPQFN
ncbi:MAG TPA: hypothetical protein DCO78_01665, partial [Chitinophagaceae bacterium]|nr:hypothetical protein [Chitinophagaceae bacterium]